MALRFTFLSLENVTELLYLDVDTETNTIETNTIETTVPISSFALLTFLFLASFAVLFLTQMRLQLSSCVIKDIGSVVSRLYGLLYLCQPLLQPHVTFSFPSYNPAFIGHLKASPGPNLQQVASNY